MTFYYLIIIIIEIVLCGILSYFLLKLYYSSKYNPPIFLAAFFMLMMIALILYLPVFYISSFEMIKILLDITLYLLIISMPFLIFFVEGIKGRVVSVISIAAFSFTTFIFGYIIEPRWDYVYNQIWDQKFHDLFAIFFSTYLILYFAFLIFRFLQFILKKENGSPKKMPIIAMSGILLALIGGIISSIIDNLFISIFTFLIGMCILAYAYLKNPNSFFFSNTKISSIMFINSESKIPYFTYGKTKGGNADIAASGIGGIMALLNEILESKHPPTKFIHLNNGFLMEHDFENNTTAIIVVDEINEQLRKPLKHLLSIFVRKYKDHLSNWTGNTSIFTNFDQDIQKIFRFVLSISTT